ncbi:uncharacterized protein LOC129981718 [Argiope bruennichi]|uniref:uncharacterized protein LOC129981718 n=1 Tax=Argiope bruennichi TaxID=94029 RepID=UPI0024956EBA|nr:uncharacterized protein LOC129981718 [Argiope bruennichi]
MKSIGFIPILTVFCLIFVFDSCQGKAINPNSLFRGNEAPNVNKPLSLLPDLDLGNMKKDPWPNKVDLNVGHNSLKGIIGGTIWEDKNKGLSLDLDLKPGVRFEGRNSAPVPNFNALGTLKWGFW